MGLKKSLLSGLVAFAVATLAVRTLASSRSGTKIGLLAGGAVAVRTLLSGGDDDAVEELSIEDPAAE
ncbi:hypothetical protein [Halorussus marinus]|uniref:hypothetical protein n=1 Tax=Halorussus marinus TaxID=2505976 RepID=UPI00106EE790|nr:hypothetical protein [Halorussus marinus]